MAKSTEACTFADLVGESGQQGDHLRLKSGDFARKMVIHIRQVIIHTGDLVVEEGEPGVIRVDHVAGQVVVAEMDSFVNGLRGDPDGVDGDTRGTPVASFPGDNGFLLTSILRRFADPIRHEPSHIGGQHDGYGDAIHVSSIGACAGPAGDRECIHREGAPACPGHQIRMNACVALSQSLGVFIHGHLRPHEPVVQLHWIFAFADDLHVARGHLLNQKLGLLECLRVDQTGRRNLGELLHRIRQIQKFRPQST